MELLVNYLTATKNKSLLVKAFPKYKDDINKCSPNDIDSIMYSIKEYTILKMKMKANEELLVSDFFDNRLKVMNVLSEFVSYSLKNQYATKYNNVSNIVFFEKLFSGFAAIKYTFLMKEEDAIISLLRERDLL